MNRWIELIVTHMLPWPIGVLVGASALSLTIGLIGLWSLWRVRRMLKVVAVLDDRVNTLTNSVALLTDTTESCFRAMSMQLQFLQSSDGPARGSSSDTGTGTATRHHQLSESEAASRGRCRPPRRSRGGDCGARGPRRNRGGVAPSCRTRSAGRRTQALWLIAFVNPAVAGGPM